MIVREIKGLYHCITLNDKTTLRLFPRQETIVADNNISAELYALEDIGEVIMTAEPKEPEPKKEEKGGKK